MKKVRPYIDFRRYVKMTKVYQYDLEDGEYFELVHEPDFHGIEFKLKNGDKVFIKMNNFDALEKLLWELRGL